MQAVAVLSRRLVAMVLGVALVTACGGTTSDPRIHLARLLPAPLEANRNRSGEPRTAKVRIYADAAVRAMPQWNEEITEQIDYASQILQPQLGVKLVVDKVVDWDRTGEPQHALRELGEADKADGVAWVIGYVEAPETVSTAMSELGDAQLFGRQVIVRGWPVRASQTVEAAAADVPAADRSELSAAHRRHKQTVVLLHMLSITLGAIHETEPTAIQHALYSPKQSTMSVRNIELLQIAVDGRLNRESDASVAKQLVTAIDKSEWGGWVAVSRTAVLGALANVVDAERAGKTFAEIPPAAYDQYKRIEAFAKQGKTDDALTELDNLLTAYPGNAAIHQLKCEILIGKPGVADPATRAACARVAELAPGDPTVHFAIAEALLRAGDLAAARAELLRAEDKIPNLPRPAATAAWQRVIGIYVGLGALTWTEDVIAKAKLEQDPAAAQAAQTRARYGLPRGAKFVTPEQEANLVEAIRKVLALVYANKFGEAERELSAGNKRWPSAPGLLAARCDLALRMGQFDAARAACASALAGDPNASWALYLTGVLLLREQSTTNTGIARLTRAIEVDPELNQAWHTLAKAYARGGNKAAREQLAKAYQAKFGRPLPQ